jgi:hypothetical protein
MVRRLSLATALAALIIALTSGVAAAHGLDVNPPGQTEAVVSGPVSQAWAQAHCQAAAPEKATAASGGVVVFTPAEALPCPPEPNPGGQIHPHAEE